MKINSYAALSSGAHLEPFEYDAGPLDAEDVTVKITHCGICHSDIHLIDNDWQISQYPLVPGHEIIGHIAELGKNVKGMSIGDRVGIGWQCNSCGHCAFCRQGEAVFCPASTATANGHFGGFSDHVRANQRFVFRIPQPLESQHAASLLCGGITVFAPLQHYNVRPTMHIAVIGVGGLGHLALQFAHAWGCEVTAFSHTVNKSTEAQELGAHHFICTQNKESLSSINRKFDFILSTIPQTADWNIYLNMLKPKGKLCMVGVSPEMNIAVPHLIQSNLSVCGNAIGHPGTIKEMLHFASRHDIRAVTELKPWSQVNDAVNKVRDGLARYRVVLEMAD